MLAGKFASQRLHMEGITKKQAEMPYFHCGPSGHAEFQSDYIKMRKN